MSRFSRESWRIEIGRQSVEVWNRAGAASDWQLRGAARAEIGIAPAAAEETEVLEAMRALVEAHVPAGVAVATVIRDECARYAVVDPPVNARRPSEIRFAAIARMKALFGDACADWIVDADWSARRRFLACAVPAAMVRMAGRCLADTGRRDGGMSTEFVAAWNADCARMQAADAWVAHAGREAVVIAACEDSGVSQVSMSRLGAGAAIGDALAEVRRCALRWNRPAPETVYLLGVGFVAAGSEHGAGVVDLSARSAGLTATSAAIVGEEVA